MLRPLAVPLAVAAALPASWTPREKTAAKEITAATLAAHVRFLADDLLEGRAPASRGSELAMHYVAATFERLGLKPAGDQGSYYQRFELVGLKSDVTTPMTFSAGGKSFALKVGSESVVAPGEQKAVDAVKDADVVFVGYGITAPEQSWDDYKVDVKGKVVLVMNNDPEDDPNLFAGKTRLFYGRWDYKYAEAARHGAAGCIIIHTEPSTGYPWQVVESSWSREGWELPAGSEPRVAVRMWATDEASHRIAALGGKDLDELRKSAQKREFQPVAIGVKLSVAVKTEVERQRTANVVGVLEGSDPKLAAEAVVVTAHHDHLGIGKPVGSDNIYNGALDNASGVASLLDIAQAVMGTKPKRSIIFAAVAAEESGLLGSEYYCAHPTVAPGKIAANLNIDGVNIWGKTKDIRFIGMGKSSLDDVVVEVARSQGRVVLPDDRPEKGSFYRSDQFNFAKIGVPAMYFGAGTQHPGHDAAWGHELHEKWVKERYHQPSDQIDDSWNLEGAVDDLQLMTVALLRVADAAKLPAWKPGDEFEAARKKALAAP